ncbi:MAG TPA: hypothetical protein VF028_00935 [Actinomycetota bacterium]|nr:hypothetical protein [Actinomycetota bacterium]
MPNGVTSRWRSPVSTPAGEHSGTMEGALRSVALSPRSSSA